MAHPANPKHLADAGGGQLASVSEGGRRLLFDAVALCPAPGDRLHRRRSGPPRCLNETVTHHRIRPGGRQVVYRDYLPERARKPKAVRQVAPELVAELGEP